jgi:hypothetical protein
LQKKLVDFFLFANIFISLGAAVFTESSFALFGISDAHHSYAFLVFFSTLFIYNLQRVVSTTAVHPHSTSVRRAWINRNKKAMFIVMLLGAAGTIEFYCIGDKRITTSLIILFVFSLAYFFPITPLRNYAWPKLLVLSGVWLGVTVVVPYLFAHQFFENKPFVFDSFSLLGIIGSRFFFLLGLCVAFDLRDVAEDKLAGITTIAGNIGERKTKISSILFLMLGGACLPFSYQESFQFLHTLALLASIGITIILLGFNSKKRNEYYFIFGLDGMILLQGILVLLA